MMWGAVLPNDLPQARLRLDFGLRPAILAFNEWAVPGLGGAFCVRQFSWACMGLRLAQEAKTTATAARIAEALEALGCWIVIRSAPQRVDDPRVQGKRKLAGRTSLSFRDLTHRGAYVTVPFRRSTTRALPGLAFCVREEVRFSALELSPAGMELAEFAFDAARDGADPQDPEALADFATDELAQTDEPNGRRPRNVQVRHWLQRWIENAEKPAMHVSHAVKHALDPRLASDGEKLLVLKQLRSEPRRAALADLLHDCTDADLATEDGRARFLSSVRDRAHAAQLASCFAFEEVRASALRAAQSLSDAIDGGAQPAGALQQHDHLVQAFGKLASDCSTLLGGLGSDAPAEAVAFCQEQGLSQPLAARVVALAVRVPLVFSVVGDRIDQGHGYTRKRLVADDAYDATDNGELAEPLGVPRPLLRLRRLLVDTGALQ